MGNRFLLARNQLARYSPRRAVLRCNEWNYDPHRMRPYGLASGNFRHRQLFCERSVSYRQARRTMNKAMRQQARREERRALQECEVEKLTQDRA